MASEFDMMEENKMFYPSRPNRRPIAHIAIELAACFERIQILTAELIGDIDDGPTK